MFTLIQAEAVVRRCSVEKVFLEILQNSQENISTWVSFLNFIENETLAQRFSCEFSKNTFFYRTPLLAVSGQDLVILPLKGWLQLQIFLFIVRILKFLEKTLLECSFYVLYYSPQEIGRGH